MKRVIASYSGAFGDGTEFLQLIEDIGYDLSEALKNKYSRIYRDFIVDIEDSGWNQDMDSILLHVVAYDGRDQVADRYIQFEENDEDYDTQNLQAYIQMKISDFVENFI